MPRRRNCGASWTVDGDRYRGESQAMADGELTLKLDSETERNLRKAGNAAGVAVESCALDLICGALMQDRWSESIRRLGEYEDTGESISVTGAVMNFDHELQTRRARGR